MPAAFEKWTVDLLDALPESSERFELIDGELYVTPSPGLPHQRGVLELSLVLGPYIKRVGGCELVVSPSDVWREPRQENRVQPDLYVVRLRHGKAPKYPFHLTRGGWRRSSVRAWARSLEATTILMCTATHLAAHLQRS